jgi:hypothetical protein
VADAPERFRAANGVVAETRVFRKVAFEDLPSHSAVKRATRRCAPVDALVTSSWGKLDHHFLECRVLVHFYTKAKFLSDGRLTEMAAGGHRFESCRAQQ